MKIDFVNALNLELYELAFEKCFFSGEQQRNFGANLPALLSHMKIIYQISEISSYEAVLLKRFTHGHLIDLSANVDTENIIPEMYPNTKKSVKALYAINRSINADKSLQIKPGALFYPNKCLTRRVIAVFTGNCISSILGSPTPTNSSYLLQFFESTHKKPDDTRLDLNKKSNSWIKRTDVNENEIREKLLIEFFMRNFYQYMVNHTQSIDIVDDGIIFTEYLKRDFENDKPLHVQLSHVSTPYVDIPFLSIDGETLNTLVKTHNEMKTTSSYGRYEVDHTVNTSNQTKAEMSGTDLYFTVSSSFLAYLEVCLYLPIEMVNDAVDIKLVHTNIDSSIVPGYLKNYRARIQSAVGTMNQELRDKESSDGRTQIERYNMIPLNRKISYTIKISLYDISSIIQKWEKMISGGYYVENSYLSAEIKKIVENIKSMAVSMYSSFIQ